MMFTGSKSVLACASMFLALAAQTSAHAIPSPALGVKGTPKRSDVQRPSDGKPCGNINPANTLDSSTAVPAAADGTVNIDVINFNAGGDGSTSVSVQVDATGAGNKFVAGTVKTNGNPKPTKVETDKVSFSLPTGTKCSGGKAKNLCLVSVKTTAGFGACVVVSQGAGAAAAPAVAPAKVATPAAPAKAAQPPAKAATAAKAPAANSNKKTTQNAQAAKKQSSAGKKNNKGKGMGKGKGKGKMNKGKQNKMNKGKQNKNQGKAAGKKTRSEQEASELFLREVIEELEVFERRALE